jgi:hypothetical protein
VTNDFSRGLLDPSIEAWQASGAESLGKLA